MTFVWYSDFVFLYLSQNVLHESYKSSSGLAVTPIRSTFLSVDRVLLVSRFRFVYNNLLYISIFRNVRKVAKSDYQLRHLCPTVRPHETTRLPLDGFSLNLVSEYFSKIRRENSRFIKLWKRITGTLRGDLCTFMIISRWILLIMRNVSDRSCTQNRNKHFVFCNFFLKIVPFMRLCGKIWYSQTGHRWQYNTAHALCMLDN
jgi:hypothetical protein